MNNRRHAVNLLILWVVTVFLAISCQQRSEKKVLTAEESDYNDSLVYQAMDVDYNHALLVVDSLEDVHTLNEAKINFYRAQIYYKMGQELSAELYYKKALAGNELYNERPAICYFAYDQLSTILTIKGDQQGALATATEGYAIAKDDETEAGQEWKAILLHDIGYCQISIPGPEYPITLWMPIPVPRTSNRPRSGSLQLRRPLIVWLIRPNALSVQPMNI